MLATNSFIIDMAIVTITIESAYRSMTFVFVNQGCQCFIMASKSEPGEKKISQIYEEGMNIFEDVSKSVEATNSSEIQAKVKKAMRLFEDTTKLVSIVGMFSSNESIEEVPTKNLKFLLLPALLGTLSLKLCVEDRMNIIETAEVYFRDFLKRCRDYEVIDFDAPEPKQRDESASSAEHKCVSGMPDLMTMAIERNAKIKRYKEQKELESQLNDLKKMLSNLAEEETERKYYLTLIKSYASQAIDEINSLEMEKPLLEHLTKARKGETFAELEGSCSRKSKRPPPKPLQPIIITRDEMQKKVFGAGYPSLPTMTVQEFYEKRIKDGDWPDPAKQKQLTLQELAAMEDPEYIKEKEEIMKEEKTEQDDPKLLEAARDWDEFKDDHRRGFGNRMNRS